MTDRFASSRADLYVRDAPFMDAFGRGAERRVERVLWCGRKSDFDPRSASREKEVSDPRGTKPGHREGLLERESRVFARLSLPFNRVRQSFGHHNRRRDLVVIETSHKRQFLDEAEFT